MAIRRISRRYRSLLGLTTILLFLGLAPVVGAAEITGRGPVVIDSATLVMTGQRIRLFGLRATVPSQTCTIGALVWACGQEARWATINRVGNHWVVCVERARDGDGAILAVCHLGGIGGPELNAWLVEEGWALATRGEATAYVAQEERAKAAGRGLWRGQ